MEADHLILELPSVDFKQRENLPTVSGIYYVIDEKNVVWYIGQAKNIYSRWQGKSHHRKFQLDSQKKKYFRIYYRLVNVDSLDEVERQEIAKYNPHLNRFFGFWYAMDRGGRDETLIGKDIWLFLSTVFDR